MSATPTIIVIQMTTRSRFSSLPRETGTCGSRRPPFSSFRGIGLLRSRERLGGRPAPQPLDVRDDRDTALVGHLAVVEPRVLRHDGGRRDDGRIVEVRDVPVVGVTARLADE